ncbi:MAG: thioredoxin [Clostridia bacterium]|nr:thioredoxin [Clostridia bacterium]
MTSSIYFVWGVRGAVAVIAVTFIILGIFNEGMQSVFTKAINICSECIGLG